MILNREMLDIRRSLRLYLPYQSEDSVALVVFPQRGFRLVPLALAVTKVGKRQQEAALCGEQLASMSTISRDGLEESETLCARVEAEDRG